jgi:UDP-N-acetylmuramoyl-tripeptide--D-alanyl-D-alanine ligase
VTFTWTDALVAALLGVPPGEADEYTTLGTDTRGLIPGALFVALEGERFDGHGFLAAARDAGALGAVVRTGTPPTAGLRHYEVADPRHALGALAAERRRAFPGPVIAITGQNGKTSTKEMVAAALGTRWRTHRTAANNNNMVGVPLTLLSVPDDSEAMVIEAGANAPGEIPRMREIIDPSIAVVTSAGAGHLEGFGTVATVIEEKLALTRDVPLAVVGVIPPVLADGARARGARRVITAGVSGAEVMPDAVDLLPDGRARLAVDGHRFTLAARGLHQAGNAMFAWAIARELDLDRAAVAAALETFTLPSGRGELLQSGRLTILNDGYNANPESFGATIVLARAMRAKRRLVFVAGTMRELGGASRELHRRVLRDLVALAPEVLALVGEFVAVRDEVTASFAGEVLAAPDADTLAPLLAATLRGDELVVLKASRGAALERVLPAILPRDITAEA